MVEETSPVEQAFQHFVQFLHDHQAASLLPIINLLPADPFHAFFTNPQ